MRDPLVPLALSTSAVVYDPPAIHTVSPAAMLLWCELKDATFQALFQSAPLFDPAEGRSYIPVGRKGAVHEGQQPQTRTAPYTKELLFIIHFPYGRNCAIIGPGAKLAIWGR